MEQYPSPVRFRSFWQYQLGGWLLYAAVNAASLLPLRNMRDEVAYKTMYLLSGFIASFAMYALCHALWRARVPMLRALGYCAVAAYVLGLPCSYASIRAELRFGGITTPLHWSHVFGYATSSWFILVAWSSLYFGIKHHHALEQERVRLQASEALARDAQLRALRYQLQPHFLFNTLNAISTLVLDSQPRLATQMIARLADLLRKTLEFPDLHQLPLAEEIAVLEEYLALEKVRFGPRLAVTLKIDPETRNALVPRFLLQPLVENAIRHGIARRPQGGALFLSAEAKANRLLLRLENDGAEKEDARVAAGAKHSRGVGLTNTRTRLEQMYGFEATLETHATSNGRYEVRISMPYSLVESRIAPELAAAR